MKQTIKTIIKRNRILHLIAIKIQRLRIKYKNSISGKNNVVINKGILLGVKYDVIGNDNSIEIMRGQCYQI